MGGCGSSGKDGKYRMEAVASLDVWNTDRGIKLSIFLTHDGSVLL